MHSSHTTNGCHLNCYRRVRASSWVLGLGLRSWASGSCGPQLLGFAASIAALLTIWPISEACSASDRIVPAHIRRAAATPRADPWPSTAPAHSRARPARSFRHRRSPCCGRPRRRRERSRCLLDRTGSCLRGRDEFLEGLAGLLEARFRRVKVIRGFGWRGPGRAVDLPLPACDSNDPLRLSSFWRPILLPDGHVVHDE
jgi:hypothetical protein